MARATLDGHALIDGPLSWKLTAGTTPQEVDLECTADVADRLLSGGLRPVDLRLETPGQSAPVVVKGLYVLENRPTDNPATRRVRVVDRRWFWPRVHINHSFNVRRNIGVRRVGKGFNIPKQLEQIVPTVRYVLWSLRRGETPWNAEKALEEVWEGVKKSEQDAVGISPSFIIDGNIKKLTGDSMPLEDLELSDDGASALARMLAQIPGADITVAADGNVHVYSIASGLDGQTVGAFKPSEDGEFIEVVRQARRRPRKVRIYFEPEVELRIDAREEGSRSSVTDPLLPVPGKVVMDNVLQIPDFELTVFGRSVAQGTWVEIETALNSWGAIQNFGQLTIQSIRRALVPYMDLWTGVRIAALAAVKADWGPRIGAIQQHFRRTYRIQREVVRRMKSIKPIRVGTFDPVSGLRAGAVAFQDFCVLSSQRYIATQLAQGAERYEYAENFDNYPDEGELDEARAAPIKVSVPDPDQGIVRLDFVMDPFRLQEMMLPSKMDNIPSADLGGGLAQGIVAWNATDLGSTKVPELDADHKVIVVLTVQPGAPNSKGRLFRLTRGPNDVAGLLPSSLSGGLGDAEGPTMEVFVRASWETARIAWNDGQSSNILRALGIDPPAAKIKEDVGISSLGNLCINLDTQDASGQSGASLDAIANSIAAAVYAGFADRPRGTMTTRAEHVDKIVGFIESIEHRLDPDGAATTTFRMAEDRQPLDLMSMMPNSTRLAILRSARLDKVIG